MIALGGLHALAALLYFSRERWALPGPLAWVSLTAACVVLRQHEPLGGLLVFGGALLLWTLWWVSIRPATRLQWVPEDARQATGAIAGDQLLVHHVRNFLWRDKRDYSPRWEDRRYDLGELSALDLFVCTWGDPQIAHLIPSFRFRTVPPLSISIETRREIGERWTALAGFMKSYELIMIAADERDVIRNRAVIRNEDVRLYRLRSSARLRRRLIEHYVAQMNRLAWRPRFYNTVFANCSTEVARLIRASGQPFPIDWRVLVSGHIAAYPYDHGLIDTSLSFAALHAAADIGAKARAARDAGDFSDRIRVGLPDPNRPDSVAA
jgi:hypothetical protein